MTELYDAWHAGQDSDDETATAPWHLMAMPHLSEVDGKEVLEIGCGRGTFAAWLEAQGAHVTAADFSPHAVEIASRRIRTAVVEDIQSLSFGDGTFDVVVSLETLEHVPGPSRALRELVRVTRPGGTLVVSGPNHVSLMGLSRVLYRLTGKRYTELGQPINKWTTLMGRNRTLRGLGCRIVAVEGRDHIVFLPGMSTKTLPLRRFPRLAYNTLTVAIKQPSDAEVRSEGGSGVAS